MQDNIIEKIKNEVSIIEIAERYNANPYGGGNLVNTKYNPLRAEKTSSLKLYRDTNSWADFGDGSGGSCIDFIMKADGIDFQEALNKLSSPFENIDYKPKKAIATNKEYMKPEIVEKCFLSPFHVDIDLNKDNHIQQLKTIAPKWLFDESTNEDIEYFKSISKFIESRGTTVHKLPNKDGDFYTMKYRYYFDEEQNKMIKWRTLPSTKSSYLYCKLTGKKTVLVVEGARDFLTASLCGFDVVALYSVNYKFIDEDYLLLKDKKVIFIDDFGANAIKLIHDNFDGEKIYFNHNLMRNLSKCESKDFSDYLYHFKNLNDFKNAIEEVTKTSGTWEDGINKNKILTLEFLDSKPNVEPLFDKFIYKGTSTVIHSDPGQGKSTLILAIIKQSIQQKKINKVIYFDADNPPSVLKDRIYNFMGEFGNDVTYWTSALSSVDEMENEMSRLCTFKNQGENVLIVIDTLTRFLNGKSIKNDNDVAPFVAKANRLVIDFGATVIIVHHSNKEKADGGRPIFQGSQKITGDTDATFGLVRVGNKLKLFRDKARFGYICDIATMDINAKELSISNFKANFIGEDEAEEEEAIDSTIELQDIISYTKDKGKISISEVQKHFLYHKTKEKRDIIWSLISTNKTIFEIEKIGKGWFCVLIQKEQPEVYSMELPECLL